LPPGRLHSPAKGGRPRFTSRTLRSLNTAMLAPSRLRARSCSVSVRGSVIAAGFSVVRPAFLSQSARAEQGVDRGLAADVTELFPVPFVWQRFAVAHGFGPARKVA